MKYFRNPSQAGKNSQKVQALRRMELPAPDYPPLVDYDQKQVEVLVETFFGERVATKRVYALFYSRNNRRDRYRITLNGQPWRDPISWTSFLAELRKSR